jgi:hypothetical protein
MAPHKDTKYTVNQRILDLQSRVLALETENKTLRTWVLGELATKINDAKNTIQGQIRIPQDGKDGRDGRDSNVPGPRGDILYIGPAEVAAQIQILRTARARVQAAIYQALAEANGPTAAYWRSRLENLKQDAGL